MINIRKLVAVDMALHGARFIVAEFAVGIIGPLILGLISIRGWLSGTMPIDWTTVLGFWLLSIAANYLPLFIYAVLIARSGTVEQEGRSESAHMVRYGVQQVIILVPFLVVIVALVQQVAG